jgi:predicted metal-dependent hydrolase
MEAVKEHIQFENQPVEIWRRPYQRSLNLRVRPDGRVRVTCGRRVSRREIEGFIRESRPFIEKALGELANLHRRYPEKKYVSDETFLYFGQELALDVVWTWQARVQVRAIDGRLEMWAPVHSSLEERRQAMHLFFKKQARLDLTARVEQWAKRMQLFPKRVSVRGQRTRWGSCTARAEISLNWKLLAAPDWVIDYVVVHELAHIRHLDHSARFWHLVEEHHPERRKARRWLRDHEPAIARQFHLPKNVASETSARSQ